MWIIWMSDGQPVEVRTEGETVPAGGSWVRDDRGEITHFSPDKGTTISYGGQLVKEALERAIRDGTAIHLEACMHYGEGPRLEENRFAFMYEVRGLAPGERAWIVQREKNGPWQIRRETNGRQSELTGAYDNLSDAAETAVTTPRQ